MLYGYGMVRAYGSKSKLGSRIFGWQMLETISDAGGWLENLV